MDNLIADGEVADAIVVTKDNTYFNFEKGDSLKILQNALCFTLKRIIVFQQIPKIKY